MLALGCERMVKSDVGFHACVVATAGSDPSRLGISHGAGCQISIRACKSDAIEEDASHTNVTSLILL